MLTKKGFTLVEMLVVISIIGALIGLSAFSLQAAKRSGRDAKRKADIELIRSGIEIYRSDCGQYPLSLGTSLVGSGSPTECLETNTYISEVPLDPASSEAYGYSSDGDSYELCTSLENGGDDTCSVSVDCGTETCNYKVINP